MTSDETLVDKFDVICRLCGEESCELFKLYLRKNKHKRVKESIKKYLNIKISPGDGLPDQICGPCIAKLDETIDFMDKCLKVQMDLQKIYEEKPSTMDIEIKPEPAEEASIIESLVAVRAEECREQNKESNISTSIKSQEDYNENTSKFVMSLIEEDALKDEGVAEKISSDLCLRNRKRVKKNVFDECDSIISEHENSHSECQIAALSKSMPTFKCTQCSKAYFLSSSLQTHINRIHKENMEKCPECKKVFRSKYLWNRHFQIHSQEKSFKCEICSKRFSRAISLRRHHEIHTTPLEQRCKFDCSICGKKFTSKNVIRAHMKLHTESRNFICDQCGKSFQTKGSLQVHYRIHTGEKPYECDICGKRYANVKPFKTHQLKHTESRPYVCPQCSKAFYSADLLRRHSFIHTDTRPYPCSFCDKSFRNQWKRKVHERIHTGEKPYKCTLCPSAFYESGNLQKHCKNVHNQDYRMQLYPDEQHPLNEPEEFVPTVHEHEEDDAQTSNNPLLGHTIFTSTVDMLHAAELPV